MKRVLFVDDDTKVLAGLRRMLRSHRREWDMVFAHGGEAALAELAERTFDVVVTDVRMPRVDGAELLAHVREHHPETVRIILSGHTEIAAAKRSVPVAHQFLSKPCDRDTLIAAVRRACALEERLQDPGLRRVLGGMVALPSPPAVVITLNALLADPHPSLDDVAAAIVGDPAMAAKLLQLVNSAFFGLAQRVTDVREAVGYLGIEMVRTLIVAVEAFQVYGGCKPLPFGSVEDLQQHSFRVAELARRLADPEHAQDAYMSGLLHDVGLLALASSAPETLTAVDVEVRDSGRPLTVVEAELIGATHADVGAYLLSLWGLPYSVVEAVAEHHRAPDTTHRSLDAVHATYLAEAMGGGARPVEHADELPAGYLEELAVGERLQAALASSAA